MLTFSPGLVTAGTSSVHYMNVLFLRIVTVKSFEDTVFKCCAIIENLELCLCVQPLRFCFDRCFIFKELLCDRLWKGNKSQSY